MFVGTSGGECFSFRADRAGQLAGALLDASVLED
jgi:hypothetical protein